LASRHDLLITIVHEQRINRADVARVHEPAGSNALVYLVDKVYNGIRSNGKHLGRQVHAIARTNTQAPVDVDFESVDCLLSDIRHKNLGDTKGDRMMDNAARLQGCNPTHSITPALHRARSSRMDA